MKLQGVELRRITMPLVAPFRTSFGTEHRRDILLLRAVTDGAEGWGECVAMAEPLYSSEYVDAAADLRQREPCEVIGREVHGDLAEPFGKHLEREPQARHHHRRNQHCVEHRRCGVGTQLRTNRQREQAERQRSEHQHTDDTYDLNHVQGSFHEIRNIVSENTLIPIHLPLATINFFLLKIGQSPYYLRKFFFYLQESILFM